MCRSLKDGFVLGVEVMIRGLSGGGRVLALRGLSCFYLAAFAISVLALQFLSLPAHEGVYHQHPHHSPSSPLEEGQFNLFL